MWRYFTICALALFVPLAFAGGAWAEPSPGQSTEFPACR